MRAFADLQKELHPELMNPTSKGALYAVLDEPRPPRLIIRHFDTDELRELVPAFVDVTRSCQAWIDSAPALAAKVRVEQPSEVGVDFVARRYHVYYTSLHSYVFGADPPEMPDELAPMRRAFSEHMGASTERRAAAVAAILARSVLQASKNTFFEDDEDKFIVVEPEPTVAELEFWREQLLRPAG